MQKRTLIFTLVAAALMALLSIVVFRPNPVSVELATVQARTLVVQVEEQGRTRARDPFVVAAPFPGRLLRSELDAGDKVEKGQVLARIALPPEDSRREAVLQANLMAAEAREAAAQAVLEEARGAFARAESELERRGELFKKDLTSREEMELYNQVADAARAKVLSMDASLEAARAEVESAGYMLLGIGYDSNAGIQNITAPVSGTVYRLFEESERVVQAGTPLLEISNDDALEIVVDLLTQDAVRVAPGDAVNITGWGGEDVLQAVVRKIEPEAFTKISTLGVEEQRVNVIADFVGGKAGLGAGYRINAGIVVWEEEDVLTIPTSAIFRRNGEWHTYQAINDIAVLTELRLGQRNREFAQVLEGLAAGDRVIEFPTDIVADSTRVSER